MLTPSPRPRPRTTRAPSGTVCLLALVGTALATVPAEGAEGFDPSAPVSWRADLAPVGTDDVNVRYDSGALRVRDGSVSPASLGRDRGYASAVLDPHPVGRPVNRVAVALDATVPDTASVEADVRGRAADGTWTEWRGAAPGAPAELPRDVVDVQARLTLWNAKGGPTAVVRAVTLTADDAGTAPAEPAPTTRAAAFSARVYATREGLVGYTTANGRVIEADDHFVALPSRRALSPKGSGQYSVQVCGPARCETAPVWDVGPWNTHDDHWNPSAQREQWKDLPRGLAQAQAAWTATTAGATSSAGRSPTRQASTSPTAPSTTSVSTTTAG
ncbi:hypothetical protein STENM327S_01978 [Streptomyces tendae]